VEAEDGWVGGGKKELVSSVGSLSPTGHSSNRKGDTAGPQTHTQTDTHNFLIKWIFFDSKSGEDISITLTLFFFLASAV